MATSLKSLKSLALAPVLTTAGASSSVLGNWTTATRPASPTAGQSGYNSTLGYIEWYNISSSGWLPIYSIPTYVVNYLVVAGGAGGGGGQFGYAGGGGGGVSTAAASSSGGSGVVIISYIWPTQRGTGGTVTSYTLNSDTYWVHRFTTSGAFTA